MVDCILLAVIISQLACICALARQLMARPVVAEKPKPIKLKKKRKVQSKEVANRQIFMANLEAYDGTSSGQQDYIK